MSWVYPWPARKWVGVQCRGCRLSVRPPRVVGGEGERSGRTIAVGPLSWTYSGDPVGHARTDVGIAVAYGR